METNEAIEIDGYKVQLVVELVRALSVYYYKAPEIFSFDEAMVEHHRMLLKHVLASLGDEESVNRMLNWETFTEALKGLGLTYGDLVRP